MNTDITIVIPTNMRACLANTLEAIGRQDVKTLVKTIHGLNPSFQRNQGADRAITKYVLFLDDDCILARGCLDMLYNLAEKDGYDMLVPRMMGTYNSAMNDNCLGGAIFIKTDVAKTIRWDERLCIGEDLDFCWRVMDGNYKWSNVPKAVVYHIHAPTVQLLEKRKQQRDILVRKHPSRCKGVF